MAPQRIQLRRTKGWRKPEGAVVVTRPSKWGNPYKPGGWVAWFPEFSFALTTTEESANGDVGQAARCEKIADAAAAVAAYRAYALLKVADIRAELAGKDLACWCPLGQPCHADVLLEIANGGGA